MTSYLSCSRSWFLASISCLERSRSLAAHDCQVRVELVSDIPLCETHVDRLNVTTSRHCIPKYMSRVDTDIPTYCTDITRFDTDIPIYCTDITRFDTDIPTC